MKVSKRGLKNKLERKLKMLTKEECENALGILRNVEIGESEDVEQANDIFEKLIKEHFDNQPLKFEELKEGMFVWDNKHHTCIKIDRIWESYNKTIYFYAIGWECCENTEYEPNRFYRKEVENK